MLYHGVDIIEVARMRRAVERWGQRLLQRIFTPGELADCALPGGGLRFEGLAARWAAKEAVAKAAGLGLAGLAAGPGMHVHWRELEVVRAPSGQPSLCFHGAAAVALGEIEWVLSLSHSAEYAVASVVGMRR
ncbi:holo-ACP synthase [Candidatus Viridilinea mediisalina]|uniref:Holo-[acyl-carrier-protein] synthase n=1 Tax=Candidatus Viridilinea mediisalina TaxID=2024553 RepID=A0A2A6RGR6_9CHLR|nr:holo-ACP synthase [Candidatus Viridilinea mediisalina]PDW02257.1 holo-[acyl-carrier-protein] synthase [Candidatus Viridilinea mediisalina]